MSDRRPFTARQPQTGDYGLTQIGGLLGFLVGVGQVLIGDGARFTHAYVITDADAGIAVEARPGGAGYVNYPEVWETRRTPAYSHLDLTDQQREAIAAAADTVVGVGYNWLDYLALVLDHWGIHPAWLHAYIARTDRLICSQLVDVVYHRAGIDLFDDGRNPGDVTPGDLTYIGDVS
jgi:hypothetical protein